MKKTILLTGLILMFFAAAKGQYGYRQGYVIKANGDSLLGYVFYTFDRQFDQQCQFKRFEIAQEIEYNPSNIKGFGFRNGRYFESKQNGNKKAFFECIVKGSVSLYIIPGKEKGQLYIEHEATGFMKLNKGTNRLQNGESYNDFRAFLSWILNKTGAVFVPSSTITYDANAIANLIRESSGPSSEAVQSYHQTPKVNYFRDYSVTINKSLWKIGITGGYQFLKINIPGNAYTYYFAAVDFSSSYRPVIGMYVNRKLFKESAITSLDLSLVYLSDSYYGYAEYYNSETNRDDIMLEFSALQIPLSLQFDFGKRKIRPYLKAGIYTTLLLTSSYVRYSEIQNDDEIYTDWISDISYDGDQGFQGALGVNLPFGHVRNICLEAGYMLGRQSLTRENSNHPTFLRTNAVSIMMRINL